MDLQSNVMAALKVAMKAKDSIAMTSLRAIKSAIIIAQTESDSKESLSQEQELKLLQRLVKQREDSAAIYNEQGRADLAEPELAQAKVIASFLPEQLSKEEIQNTINRVITDLGAQTIKDMGKVMGVVSQELLGKADGKTIASLVKSSLSSKVI